MRTRPTLAVAAGTAAVLGVLVVLEWGPLLTLDQRVTDLVTGAVAGSTPARDAVVIVTHGLGPWPLRAVVAVLALVLALRGRRRAALWALLVIALGGLLGGALKLLVGRDRPSLQDPLLDASGYAWPSGHAMTGAVAAGVLLVLAPPAVRRRLWPLAVVAALAVGLSRVALGVHWTSDVVSGWLLGTAVVLAGLAAQERSDRSHAAASAKSALAVPGAGTGTTPSARA